jgi:hypothetical protein
MGKELYFTRRAANRGAKLFLTDPLTAKKTEDFLVVLGIDSDEARRAEAEFQRKVRDTYADLDDEDKEAKRDKVLAVLAESSDADQLEKAARLVIGWGGPNFADPFTKEAVKEVLGEAPQLVDAVVVFSANRADFFAAGPSDSATTPKPTSDSASP